MSTAEIRRRAPAAAVLSENAIAAISAALEQAESVADFFGRADAIVGDDASRFELPTDLGEPDPLEVASKQGSIDVENAIAVHQYLGEMDRANAADPRLWNYLAFVTFRSYMERRWPLEDGRKWKERAKRRWVLRNSTRGSLVRHGVSRLWWVAHLTYEPKQRYPLSARDPYGYTREAFRNEDRILALFDREVGALHPLVRVMLERAENGGDAARDRDFRDLMRTLTLVQGYRDLALIDPWDATGRATGGR
jgi:hypothetical protein